MSENKFAAIKGHRSVIDVAAIKKGNEERKRERLLKSVADKLSDLGDVIRDHKAKKVAAKILSEE
jgi:cytochrome c556